MGSKPIVISVVGIRPDFIRMSRIFALLDEQMTAGSLEHIIVHTGQHFDAKLSDNVFAELKIRNPDYNLGCGKPGKDHVEFCADVSVKLTKLCKKLIPYPTETNHLVIFLGDSNSVTAAVPLKKEGFRIAHIEAGMRSGDQRMLEETNRIVCDHCSDWLYAYHEDYKQNLIKEGIPESHIVVTGNTIVDSVLTYKSIEVARPRKEPCILVDIHRPENFKSLYRMDGLLRALKFYKLNYPEYPIKFISFPRTIEALKKWDDEYKNFKEVVTFVDLMKWTEYLDTARVAKFVISDSGTAQEELVLIGQGAVIVPRDYTERPQSYDNHCSFKLSLDMGSKSLYDSLYYIDYGNSPSYDWLYADHEFKSPAKIIVDHITNRVLTHI